MLFKTTIKLSGYNFSSTIEANNESDAASKAVSAYYSDNALFIPVGNQPLCGWASPVYRLPIGNGTISERTIVKVSKMHKVEEAATIGKIGRKFFDEEMKESGITPTKESRIEYKAEQASWLKHMVFSSLKEAYIRRWFDKQFGNSYYSMKLVSYVDNTKYVMHTNMQYGYGDAYSLLRQSGIAPEGCLVREWLKYNDITVVDEGYGRKVEMYKSAL